MKVKKNYPALYRWAYANGKEKEFIPREIRTAIPRQTQYNWRNTSKDELNELGIEMELKEQLDTLIKNDLIISIDTKYFLISLAKFHFETVEIMGINRYHRYIASNKESFVAFVEKFTEVFPKQQILKWFRLSMNKYQNWHSEVNFTCGSSKLKLCAKRHPFQVTQKEFKIMEKYLNDPLFSDWARSALHSLLLKKNILHMARSTFYKHARQILPIHLKKKTKKPKYVPLRGHYVNEYWHMDLSYFKTSDGQTSYIYSIIDNYSRYVIAWRCEEKISNKVVGALINEALEKVTLKKLNLVSDGGSENVNYYIRNLFHQFYEEQDIEVIHEIALKSIRQSNSMIERFFRTLKYQYLYLHIPMNHDELLKNLPQIMHEYNQIRPHHSLNHRTPFECYNGVQIPDFSKQIKKAQRMRYKKNKNCSCTVCIC